MNKSKFEKYNTPFQRLLRNMFADSIKDEWKTNEERDLFDKFFFLLGAAEQYEVEEEMTEYIKVHPDVTIDDWTIILKKLFLRAYLPALLNGKMTRTKNETEL